MFSYLSTKNTQSTIEQNLIDQIQFIANEIFDNHTTSIARTDQQQISLELSPPTSEDGLDFQDQQKHQYQKPKYQQQLSQVNYYTNLLRNQRPFQHSLAKHQQQIGQIKQFSQKQYEEPTRRLTKSMLSAHNNIKEPGSFSNHYIANRNGSINHVSPLLIKQPYRNTSKLQQKQNDNSLHSPLRVSNMNKSNILMGILKQVNPINSKTPQKKGKFSSSYASNYLSPYSTRSIKKNPKSYMQKSNSQTKKPKQAVQIQYIKQRINQNIEPHISYRKEKTQRERLKNPKLSSIKSKYKQTKPLMHEYKSYADEHIYKKMRTQMAAWEQKKKQYEIYSPDDIENNWQQFISGEERFLENKKQWRASKRLQKIQRQQVECIGSPMKNIVINGRGSGILATPPKMTPEDFVKKYKRQKQKLREKLQANEVSNFLQKSYQDSKKYGRQFLDSVWGSSLNNQEIGTTFMEGFSTVNDNSHQEKNISKLLISEINQQGKNKHENFFISVGEEDQNPRDFKKNNRTTASVKHQNKLLARSSIYQAKPRSTKKSTSRDQKSSNHLSKSSNKHDNVNSLSPFIKKSSYLSKDQSIPFDFDPRKHNLPQFNEQIASGRSKSNSKKSKVKQINKISELLNPKYFKSINELQQYASNSKSQQRKENMKRTFRDSKQDSCESDNLIKIHENEANYRNMNKSPKQCNQRRNQIAGFDHKMMNKIIDDLDQMRCEIEENKKKRKYKIENYRNFSNVRNVSQAEMPDHGTGSFVYGNEESMKREDINNHANKNMRENHRFMSHTHNQSPQQFELSIRHSRSVSPIEQQDSIINYNHNLSLSVIQNSADQNNQTRNINLSQFSSPIANSNMILVKSQQEVQFILENKFNKN